jgi:hypothetical protein
LIDLLNWYPFRKTIFFSMGEMRVKVVFGKSEEQGQQQQGCQRERRIACGHKAGQSERWSCGRGARVGNSPLSNGNDGRADHDNNNNKCNGLKNLTMRFWFPDRTESSTRCAVAGDDWKQP